jgi:TonB family protein
MTFIKSNSNAIALALAGALHAALGIGMVVWGTPDHGGGGEPMEVGLFSGSPHSLPVLGVASKEPIQARAKPIRETIQNAPQAHMRPEAERGDTAEVATLTESNGQPGNNLVLAGDASGSLDACRIQDLLRAHLIYPVSARRQNQTGQVVVAFNVTARGEIQNLEIFQTSGYWELDQAVVRAVRRLKRVPGPLCGERYTVPVVFKLLDTQA